MSGAVQFSANNIRNPPGRFSFISLQNSISYQLFSPLIRKIIIRRVSHYCSAISDESFRDVRPASFW